MATDQFTRFGRIGRVADMLDVDRHTVRRRVKDGMLPPPVKLRGVAIWDLGAVAEAVKSLGESQASTRGRKS